MLVRSYSGYTLIELLACLVVIGIMSALSMAQFNTFKQEAIRSRLVNYGHQLLTATNTVMGELQDSGQCGSAQAGGYVRMVRYVGMSPTVYKGASLNLSAVNQTYGRFQALVPHLTTAIGQTSSDIVYDITSFCPEAHASVVNICSTKMPLGVTRNVYTTQGYSSGKLGWGTGTLTTNCM